MLVGFGLVAYLSLSIPIYFFVKHSIYFLTCWDAIFILHGLIDEPLECDTHAYSLQTQLFRKVITHSSNCCCKSSQSFNPFNRRRKKVTILLLLAYHFDLAHKMCDLFKNDPISISFVACLEERMSCFLYWQCTTIQKPNGSSWYNECMFVFPSVLFAQVSCQIVWKFSSRLLLLIEPIMYTMCTILFIIMAAGNNFPKSNIFEVSQLECSQIACGSDMTC